MRTLLAFIAACATVYVDTAPQERLQTVTSAVIVDVVVRDRNGRPVIDLGKQDFELYEDGVRQELADAMLVAPGSLPASVPSRQTNSVRAPTEVAQPTHSRPTGVSFVALVFDRLSPEARAASHKAALSYVDTLLPEDFAGVFLSDLSLRTIQAFTRDRKRLREAVSEAGSSATAVFDRDAIRSLYRSPSLGDSHPAVPVVASPESPGRPAERDRGQAAPEAVAAAVTDRSEMIWEEMAGEQQGYATTRALLALAAGLGGLPGRKSIVLFAEGISIPPAVLPNFRNVVLTANRGNVSIYTVDAAGLRVHSTDAATGREVRAIGDANLTAVTETDVGGRPLVSTLERNEDVLRKDPRTSLTLLANETGGFSIHDTNDLGRGLRDIDMDRRFHYILSYTPKNTQLTGEWRALQIRVPGRDVIVRNRAGYLALGSGGGLPVLAHEGPALAALDRRPLPAQVPVRAGAFVFPEPRAAAARLAVLVAVDGGVLAEVDKSKGTVRTDFTILARLKDATGEVVRKGSQPYRLTAPAANLGGEVLFFRQPTLPPGTYTFEYVVYDALRQQAGAGSAPVVVSPSTSDQVRVSSLMIVRRTERVPAGQLDATNPLYYGDLLLYPNLGEPISKRHTAALSFAFTVIPGAATPRASLTLTQGERTLGEAMLSLGPPDAKGVTWHVSQLPLASLAPGEYTLSVTVDAGSQRETRRASFRTIE